MKYILLLFIFFTSCQKEVSATLKINIKPSDNSVETKIWQYRSKLFKDSKFFKKVWPPEFPVRLPQIVEIDSLEKGNYTLEYPDLYGNFIKKNISIQESKIYSITIYPDITKRKSQKNIISELENGDELEVKMESNGCFHSFSGNFHISKKDNQLEISRNKISKILTKDQEKYLINLENSVRLLEDGGCTTSEDIIFIGKNKTDTITDSGCQFQSMQKFAKFLKRNGL